MASTSARYADFLRQSDRTALHVKRDGRWQALLTRNADAQAPAGGISSCVRDLARWMRLQLGNGMFEGRELIKADALEATHTPVIREEHSSVTGHEVLYGLGWGMDYRTYGTTWHHAGAFEKGARTLSQLIPEHQLGIVVLTNAFPTGFPEGIADSFCDIVFDGAPSRDWTVPWNEHFAALLKPANDLIEQWGKPPENASPALPLASYVGTYANDYLGQGRTSRWPWDQVYRSANAL